MNGLSMATTLDTERLADEGSGWIRLPREPGRAAERIRATYTADERDELIALLLAMGSSGERRQARVRAAPARERW